jgi:hypothetical protein
MPKYTLFCLLSALTAICGGTALAGVEAGPKDPAHTPALTWEQFKESCLHPEQFNNQVAPKDIRVQCTDVTRDFITASPGQVPLPGARRVVYAVFSNKYHVNADQREVPMLNKGGSCLRFREVERALTIEKRLTCEDILGIKSDLAEYCASSLMIAKGANPKLVESHDTGRVIDTCNGGAITDFGKKPTS